MKTHKIIVIFFIVTILIFSYMKCSTQSDSGTVQTSRTTSGSIDISTMPANSEFKNEEPE